VRHPKVTELADALIVVGDLIEELVKEKIQVDLQVWHDGGGTSMLLRELSGEFELRASTVYTVEPEEVEEPKEPEPSVGEVVLQADFEVPPQEKD